MSHSDLTCARCGSANTRVEPGAGPHWKALRCLECGAHRWLPKPPEIREAEREAAWEAEMEA